MFGAICEFGRVAAVYFNVCAIVFLQGGALTVPLSKSNQQKPSNSKIESSQCRSDAPNSGGSESPCAADWKTDSRTVDCASGGKPQPVDGPVDGDDSDSGHSESTSSTQIVFLWDRVVKQSNESSTVLSSKFETSSDTQNGFQNLQLSSERADEDAESILHRMDVNSLPPAHGPPSISQS